MPDTPGRADTPTWQVLLFTEGGHDPILSSAGVAGAREAQVVSAHSSEIILA